MSDIITLSLYSKISKGNGVYKRYEGVLEEVYNINRILEWSSKSAIKNERPPPKVILRFCLISNDVIEIPQEYVDDCHIFFKSGFEQKIPEEYKTNFIYEKFIPAPGDEVLFMKGLLSVGSYIDINKMRFIIENKGSRNLQMDTNTFIPCWDNLYENTFLKSEDSYGCSRCSLYYIAVHNKIVYVSENSNLPNVLSKELNEFYKKHKDNDALKLPEINALYDYVWGESMYKMDCSHKLIIADKVETSKTFPFYPAAIANNPVFTLNAYYLQAQHQTWNPNKAEVDLLGTDFEIDISDITGVCIDTGFHIDKAAIETIFTTYSNIPLIHDYKVFDGSEKKYANAGYIDFSLFLNNQNLKLDQYIIDKIFAQKFPDLTDKVTEDLHRVNLEIESLPIDLNPIALDNFCKIKVYIGYTVNPMVSLNCTSQFVIARVNHPKVEKSDLSSADVPDPIAQTTSTIDSPWAPSTLKAFGSAGAAQAEYDKWRQGREELGFGENAAAAAVRAYGGGVKSKRRKSKRRKSKRRKSKRRKSKRRKSDRCKTKRRKSDRSKIKKRNKKRNK